jgi:hypothetical protein
MITSEPINDATGAPKDVVAIAEDTGNPILKAVQDLEAIGFVLTPLHGKAPFRTDWQNEKIDRANYPTIFTPDVNIGIRTGRTSGVGDIDADCGEVVAFLKEFLPDTNASYGRNSRPESHFIFSVENPGPRTPFVDAIREETDKKKAMILEYRGNDVQSMCPPSLHPDEGEGRLQWKDGSFIRNRQRPTQATREVLMKACAKSAMGVMRLRYSEEQIAAHPKAAANMQKWQAIVDGRADDNGTPLLAANPQPSLSEHAASLVRNPSSKDIAPASNGHTQPKTMADWLREAQVKEDQQTFQRIEQYLHLVSREDWLNCGFVCWDLFGDDGREIWTRISKRCPEKFDPADQEATWRDIKRRAHIRIF